MNFLGIGAGKSATTWITKCLDEHPEICMSRPKEVNFFLDEHYTKGEHWYRKHFSHCNPHSLLGEYSPKYLGHPRAVERIHHDFPNTKLIISLRNPIDRFVSSAQYKTAMGRDTETDITKSTLEKYKNDLKEGLYAKHIKRYLKLFPKEQILILLYEDIQKYPLKTMQYIYSFLGVDASFIPPSLSKKQNVTGENTTKFPFVHRWTTYFYRKSRKQPLLFSFLKKIKMDFIFRFVRKRNIENPEKVKTPNRVLDPKIKEELLSYYKDDIRELESLLGRDLSFWRR